MIDTHCHLDWKKLQGNLPDVMDRAAKAGVSHIVSVAMLAHEPRRVLEIAARYPDRVSVIAGLHPHDAAHWDPAAEAELRDLQALPIVKAVGEIGLDYFRDWAPRDRQRQAFRDQLAIAHELRKPVAIHCRDAYDETFELMETVADTGWRGVAHCFSGTLAHAERFMALGLAISFAGNVTKTSSEELLHVAASIPVDRLVVETDAPFMIPRGAKKAKFNEPAHVRHTLRAIAEARGMPEVELEHITDRTARRAFGLPDPGAPERRRTIVYAIRGSLYVNLTNRCDCRCAFCPRERQPEVGGYWLGLREDEEPTAAEVIGAIGDPREYDEIVFCGFGEPFLRLPELLEVARWVKSQGGTTRVNTNGHGSLIHGRDVAPELAGAIDSLSISLNTHDLAHYQKIMRPQLAGDNFKAMLDFIQAAKSICPVTLTALDGFPGVDMEACRTLSQTLGVHFRDRTYTEMG